MIKTITRTILLTFLVCFTTIFAKAQVGYDYAQYDLGISVGFNSFYGDVTTSKSTKAVSLNFNYNQTAYLHYIFEAQFGKLAGGDSTKDLLGRQFAADYQSYAFRVQLQAGEFIDYSQSQVNNVLKNFYVGTGIGIIFNNITQINRYSLQIPGYYTPGDNSGNQIFIPARIGYELKIFNRYEQPEVKIDIGYQTNFVLGDNLDGLKGGLHNDTFSQFTIGVKFSIGSITSNSKQITY